MTAPSGPIDATRPRDCETCGQPHVTRYGRQACTGHVDECEACEWRTRNRVGEPCVKCGADRVALRACRRDPARGGTVCGSHGAGAPQVRAANGRNRAMAAAVAELQLGGRVEVSHTEAMVEMVQEAYWNVAVYRRLVQSLSLLTIDGAGDIEGDDEDVVIDPRILASGLASRVDPGNWKAAPHVWVSMYDAERERLMRWSKWCREAGVEEAQLRLLEREADRQVEVAHLIAEELNVELVSEGVAGDLLARVFEQALPRVLARAFRRVDALEVQEAPGA